MVENVSKKITSPWAAMFIYKETEQLEFPSDYALATRLQNDRATSYFAVTNECVMACTDNAIRFCTPTLRINFAT
jgi:hypothetical protein